VFELLTDLTEKDVNICLTVLAAAGIFCQTSRQLNRWTLSVNDEDREKALFEIESYYRENNRLIRDTPEDSLPPLDFSSGILAALVILAFHIAIIRYTGMEFFLNTFGASASSIRHGELYRIGIPVGLILLLSFLVRVYMALMYGEDESASPLSDSQNQTGLAGFSFSLFFHSLQRFSIFSLGFIIVLGVLILWLVPSLLGDAFRISIDVIREFKWFFLGASVVLAGIVVWIIHLRYRLSRLHLENQLALEKYRIEKQLSAPSGMGMTLISDTLTMPLSRKEG